MYHHEVSVSVFKVKKKTTYFTCIPLYAMFDSTNHIIFPKCNVYIDSYYMLLSVFIYDVQQISAVKSIFIYII